MPAAGRLHGEWLSVNISARVKKASLADGLLAGAASRRNKGGPGRASKLFNAIAKRGLRQPAPPRAPFSDDHQMPAGPRFASWTKPPLFLFGGGLRAGCRSAAVRVTLSFRMGLGAACNPLPIGVLLGDCVTVFVSFFVDRYCTVIPARARSNRRCRCHAGTRDGSRRNDGHYCCAGRRRRSGRVGLRRRNAGQQSDGGHSGHNRCLLIRGLS